VLDRLRAFFSSRTDIGDALTPLDLEAHPFDVALRNALKLSKRWLAMPPVEMKSLVRDIVEQIIVASDRIEIRLSRVKIAAALEAGGRSQRPIAFNAEHLRRILAKYAIYYNEVRTHVSLGKDAPCTRPIERFGDVIAHPILGGLHHRYTRI
jgi:hypothetical protein